MTVKAWTDALEFHGLTDEARDAPRIAAAFRVLAATASTWPSPRDFADVLEPLPAPPRPFFHKLPEPERTPDEVKAAAARRRELVEQAASVLRIPLNRDDRHEA